MTCYEQLPFQLLDYFSAHGVEPEDHGETHASLSSPVGSTHILTLTA